MNTRRGQDRADAPGESDGLQVSRRTFLQVGATIGGELLLGFQVPQSWATETKASIEPFVPNAFIRIPPEGKITLVMPQAEMGQGVYTAHATILAEELDVTLEQITVEASPPSDALYGNPIFHIQATGNSNSIRAFWLPLRKAAATARSMLVAAAAAVWQVDPATCRTENGSVIHKPSGRLLPYGVLVSQAARRKAPANPPLKEPRHFKLIGTSVPRVDTPAKVNGTAIFGIDAMPPGVRFAALAACPVFGGKVAKVEGKDVRNLPGVRQIVVLEDLVAVVADDSWTAQQGLAALGVTWDEGENAHVTTEEAWTRLEAASRRPGAVAKSVGNVDRGLTEGDRVDAIYRLPFLAHAPMEPMNCTVDVRADACEVWVGSQVQARGQAAAAKVTSLPLDKVSFHNHLIGGGFGRRLDVDGIEKAVRIARHVSGPIKVMWSREEDIRQDVYRPIYLDRLSACLKDGRINAWNHRIAGSSVVARWLPQAYAHDIDFDAVDSAVDMPYDIPNRRVQYVREEPPAVPTGFWRGVGPNNNVFAIESFVDELAARAGRDAVAFRLAMLDKSPRLKAVLELAARKAGWGKPLPPRVGRGVAVQPSFASFIATVLEAEIDRSGEVNLRRIVCAVDTGIAVNPDTIVAQLEGGLIFGLTAALYGKITIENGRVREGNFNDYRMLRIDQTPSIEVHVIRSSAFPGGIGETGTTAAAPSLCNAVHAAIGVRVRTLPIDREALASERPS